MRSASFLRMSSCNAFAGSFPCPIPWAWKMGSIFDSHAVRLSNLGDKIWSLDAVEWKMTPVFDSWPGREYDLGGHIGVSTSRKGNLGVRFTLPTTPSIEFGGLFYPSDHPEHRIWRSVLPFRPPRASNLGVRFTLPTTPSIESGGPFYPSDHPEHQIWGSFSPFRQLGSQIWGVKLDQRPPGRVIWGVKLDQRPPGKGNLEGQIRSATSRKGNLGGRIGPATSRRSNLGGRIRLFTCFTPKIFTHYLIVEWIGTPIFFENKGIDLLESLSKGARFGTRAGREWEQEHRFEVLEAWKWKEAPPPPPLLRIGTLGFASFQTDKGRRNSRNPLKIQAETLHWERKICSCLFLFWEANEIECK